MNQLNPPQKQAAQHTGSPLLVLAGAGSGKTRVITQKIAWLMEERAVSPWDITAVTFTNKAAREMKQRVGDTVAGRSSIKGLTVSTFHSLGMKILKSETAAAGLRKGFSIIDPRDAINVVADLMRADLSTGRELIERSYQRISSWKNLGITPETLMLEDDDPISRAAAGIYQQYQRYLLACNSVDLDDLILGPVQLIRNDQEVREKWQRKIKYLLVDEYQDTNGVQYELIKLLAKDGRRLTVVGDDDQSIYAWRGAKPENLLQLKEDYPDLQLVKLEQNYRSFGRILKVANHLIGNNPRPFEKILWSDMGYGDPIDVFQAKNEEHEAEKVVSSIMKSQFQSGAKYKDFAILYRSNHLARILEIKLREMRIPYKLSGGHSFFDRTEIRDLLAYLRLLGNTSDDSAFLRIVNTPRRGIGATSLEKIAELATRSKQNLFDTIFDIELVSTIKPKQCETLKELASLLDQVTQMANDNDPIGAIDHLLEGIAYERWLSETCEAEVAKRRWENVKLLRQWIENSYNQSTENLTLADLVNELILTDILEKQGDDEEQDVVHLMTLHAAKGLEFKNVYIVGVEEEILPHRVSITEGSCEEERRLFYVGITRAMEKLTLSYASKRKRFGDHIECDPSRFINELPVDDLNWNKVEGETPVEQQQDLGRAYLAKIRAARAAS